MRTFIGHLDPRTLERWCEAAKAGQSARDFFRGLRKLRAIEKIKAQPFFRPRDDFYIGLQWSPGMIQVALAQEHANHEFNRICVLNLIGVDMAEPSGDRTVVNYDKEAWGEPVDDIVARAERDGMRDAKSRRIKAMVENMITKGSMGQVDAMLKAVATYGSSYSKEWLEPDGAGGLVGMSQRLDYDDFGNLIEVGEPEQTGGVIKL